MSRIESGTDGWQGTAWLLERLYPTRFSRPEIQISLNNSFNQTLNALSITISPEEAREIESRAEPIREAVAQMMERYRPGQLGSGNGQSEALPVEAHVVGPPITRKDGDENSPAFWSQFVGDPSRAVQKQTAIYAVATIVNETIGRGAGQQAITAFRTASITVADVLSAIDKLCGGSPVGWQRLQKRAGIHAGPGARTRTLLAARRRSRSTLIGDRPS